MTDFERIQKELTGFYLQNNILVDPATLQSMVELLLQLPTILQIFPGGSSILLQTDANGHIWLDSVGTNVPHLEEIKSLRCDYIG